MADEPTTATVTVPVVGPLTVEKYTFRPFYEAGFAGLTAVGILAFELAVNFQPATILSDPQTYGLMVVGAVVRAFGAAGMNVLIRLVASKA